MKTILRYTLLTASRDWLFMGLAVIILMAYAFSLFVGNTALVEQSQMSLAYFSGSSRIIVVTGLIVFVCFHVRRSFENREIEAILSKPISRSTFVVSYWLGFSLLALLATLPILVLLALMFHPNLIGLILWGVSLALEIALVSAFAMLASLMMKSAVSSVMASFAFYLISRLMGFFVAAMDNPNSLMGGEKYGWVLEGILKIISTVIPRLDMYAKSQWLIYGVEGQADVWVFPAQSIVFIGLLLAVAVFDFRRKQF